MGVRLTIFNGWRDAMAENRFVRSMKSTDITGKRRLGVSYILFLFILAVISITICSKSSPVYPLNNWDDANCFFTVGRTTVNGQVMYRDIFEQKGPWLYFIYAFAALISGGSFFGAYLIEIAAFFVFLLFSSKTVLLFCDRRAVILMPFIAAAVCTAPAFEQGGSAEELCLPLIAYSLYAGLKSIVSEKPVSRLEWFFIGITSGTVLWIKFSLLGFYLGCGVFLVFYYIKQKWHREFISFLFMLLAGEAVISVPVFAYFIINGALRELFDVYFYCNIFVYSVRSVDNRLLAVVLNLFEGTKSLLYSFGFICAVNICGGIYLFFRSRRMFGFVLCSCLSAFLLIYVGGRRYIYYSLVLAVFAPLGLVLIYKVLRLLHKKKLPDGSGINTVFGSCMLCYTVLTSLIWSPNTYMMAYSRSDMPQYKFAETISQTKDPTILNFRFLDGGFYTACGILPNCRFFCGLNIPYATSEQERYVRDGDVDYLITRDETVHLENYKLISIESFEAHKNSYSVYYLYQKIT